MPKRRIDPATGKPRLTDREQGFIDEYIKNGGNGSQAASAAGYGPARPDQSAYQVLHRAEVQRHIRERIAESRVSADEIIGTLASFMRGRLGGFFDESGEFSIQLAKEKGIDHLIKSVSGTTRQIEATGNRPAQVVKTYRAQLHSPIQAATALARILGIDRKSLARRQVSGDAFAEAMAADFRVSTWLDDLIQKEMKEQDLPRAEVIEQLLQVRPEIAKYIKELPGPDHFADLSLRDTTRPLGLTIDFILALATNAEASPDTDPVVEAHQQIQAVIARLNSGATTPGASRDAIGRINSRLSNEEREDLHLIQFDSLILHNMTQTHLTRAEALDAVRQQAAELADLQAAPSPEFVEQCISDYLAAQTAPPDPQPGPEPIPPLGSSPNLQPVTSNLQPDFPAQDSGLTALDSQANLQPELAVLAEFDRKYDRIDRHFQIGQHHRFVDLIHEIMKDQTLTPEQAIDAMRRAARQSTWFSGDDIERCIAEYATLDPRLASASIAPLPPPLRAIDRYLRQPPPPPQPAVESSTPGTAHTPNPKRRQPP